MKNSKGVKIVLSLIPIIIIVTLLIYIFLNIYNRNSHDNKIKYENVNVSEDYIVKRYFYQISEMFKNSDLSQILSIIDLEDEKYAAMGSRRFG